MKKVLIVGAVVFAVVLVLGAAGLAYAQTRTPGQGGYGPGMMGGWGYGPMHTYMVEALADALHLDPQAVQDRMTAGETPWQIAQSTGLSNEQVRALLEQVHDTALDKAVAAGALTQEQAYEMEEHMDRMWANGSGPGADLGAGPCHR